MTLLLANAMVKLLFVKNPLVNNSQIHGVHQRVFGLSGIAKWKIVIGVIFTSLSAQIIG